MACVNTTICRCYNHIMRQYGYKKEHRWLEINGEMTTVELSSSDSSDQRDFFVPSIPLWGRIAYDDNRLHVAGSNQHACVVLPNKVMSREESRVEFYPSRVPFHAAAILLALEQQEQPQIPCPSQIIREVLDPSLIIIPGI